MPVRQADEVVTSTVRLGPYESPEVPDVFLIMRT